MAKKKKSGSGFRRGPKSRARGKYGTKKPYEKPAPPAQKPKEHIGTTIGKAGKTLSGKGIPVEDWFK